MPANSVSSKIPIKQSSSAVAERKRHSHSQHTEAKKAAQQRAAYGAASAYHGILPEQFTSAGNFRNRYLNLLRDERGKEETESVHH